MTTQQYEPELASDGILRHVKQEWIMGCPCLVCKRVDFKKTHIAAATLTERARFAEPRARD